MDLAPSGSPASLLQTCLPVKEMTGMNFDPTLRIARASDKLESLIHFYCEGLGLDLLFRFENHDGFDGIMIGRRGAPYHLEFTQARYQPAEAVPGSDNLLVFYLPEPDDWAAAVNRMRRAGFDPVPSFNPYWDMSGATFEDPDGYRVVLQQAGWNL